MNHERRWEGGLSFARSLGRTQRGHRRLLAGITILILAGLAGYIVYPYVNHFLSPQTQGPVTVVFGPTIDAAWVHQFMGNVSARRGVPFTETSTLDRAAQQRFATMVQQPDITHYGYTSNFYGEVVFYPGSVVPASYLQDVISTAPVHWELLADTSLVHYGFYIGVGQTYIVESGCPVTELHGPGINITSFFQGLGCHVFKATESWLVIELNY